MKNIFGFIFLSTCCFIMACTPKANEGFIQDTRINSEQEISQEVHTECETFKTTRRKEAALDAYSIYSDFLELGKYTESFDYWKMVYKHAPGGYGEKPTIFTDGILYYTHFYESTHDAREKKKYADKIFELYEEAMACFPQSKPYLNARRAYDYYYHFSDRISKKENFQMFKYSFNTLEEVPAFIINPFISLMQDGYRAEFLETDTIKKYAYEVFQVLESHKNDTENKKTWKIVRKYSSEILAEYEKIEGFYPCAYYRKNYLSTYRNNPRNRDSIRYVYKKLQWGRCEENDSLMKAMKAGLQVKPDVEKREEPKVEKNNIVVTVREAYDALEQGDYGRAIKGFKGYLDRVDDPETEGEIAYVIAQIYYIHLDNFPASRTYARKAAEYKGNWGEPYILIGKLYASSGSLCGSGSGWDARVVVWPAVDKWNYAKHIDPSVTEEADELIHTYVKYMPSQSRISSRTDIKEGDSYKIGCWIQETTTVRAAP